MQMRTSDRIPVLLRKIYTDLKNPASFSSPYRLYAKAKKINSKIKLWDVTDWLDTQKSYTLHRRIKTKFRRRKVLTRGIQYQYQVDLVNYSKLKRDNSGYTFVLSIIDCFSQLAFAIPIKRKTGEKVAAALRRAFDHMGDPKKLHTDQGKDNQHVKELLQERGMHHFSTFQDVNAQIVEHFNRTLREAILQYMTDRQSLRYVETLPNFLYGYNNRPHLAIYPFSPAHVNAHNQRAVHEIQCGDYLRSECKKHKYQIGDKVRIASYRNVFRKSYQDTTFTRELFEIVDTLQTNPPTYKLKDLKEGELIEGTFYEEELQSSSREWKRLMPSENIPLPVLLRDLVEVGS